MELTPDEQETTSDLFYLDTLNPMVCALCATICVCPPADSKFIDTMGDHTTWFKLGNYYIALPTKSGQKIGRPNISDAASASA